jgi:hypothetical protein
VWSTSKTKEDLSLETKDWSGLIKKIVKIMYIFEHCNQQKNKNYFFTIVFENLSIEILSLLIVISQNYSFINLKRSENVRLNNDLESDFQLNLASDKLKLNSSTLCLLISNNPRYEGYYLNLNLRQRVLKGNFKCITIGSLIDLTFAITFLGSNLKILKSIAEGNNLICQDLKFSKNPMIISNNELFKRADGENSMDLLKVLRYANVFTSSWNGLNVLAPTLTETGIQSISKFVPLNKTDLSNFSSLYFLNVNTTNNSNIKQIAEYKLLNFSNRVSNNINVKKLLLDQAAAPKNEAFYNRNFYSSNDSINYHSLPSSMFYENEETFINTEGLIKRTTKVIFREKTRNNWQILRQFLKGVKNSVFLEKKNNELIFFNSKKLVNFKNFMYFQHQATQSLTNLNFYLSVSTKPFILYNKLPKFKLKTVKLLNTKLKYWVDDFFCGGKDEYSQNSLIMTNCSKILRLESTNF